MNIIISDMQLFFIVLLFVLSIAALVFPTGNLDIMLLSGNNMEPTSKQNIFPINVREPLRLESVKFADDVVDKVKSIMTGESQ